jgi:mannosyltransferase OCH1-like enzyme
MAEKSQRSISWFLNQYFNRDLNSGTTQYQGWYAKDREKFIENEYPWFLQTYRSYPYEIQRIDVAKYFILFHFGGFYLDLDIGCRRELRYIIDAESLTDHVLLAETQPFGLATDMMASSRRHPFMGYVIKQLESHNHWYGLPFLTVMLSTGPVFLTRVYNSYPCKNQIKILEKKKYAGTTEESYFFHTEGNSWHRWDTVLIMFVYKYWWKLTLFLLVLFLARYVLGKYIIRRPIYVRLV